MLSPIKKIFFIFHLFFILLKASDSIANVSTKCSQLEKLAKSIKKKGEDIINKHSQFFQYTKKRQELNELRNTTNLPLSPLLLAGLFYPSYEHYQKKLPAFEKKNEVLKELFHGIDETDILEIKRDCPQASLSELSSLFDCFKKLSPDKKKPIETFHQKVSEIKKIEQEFFQDPSYREHQQLLAVVYQKILQECVETKKNTQKNVQYFCLSQELWPHQFLLMGRRLLDKAIEAQILASRVQKPDAVLLAEFCHKEKPAVNPLCAEVTKEAKVVQRIVSKEESWRKNFYSSSSSFEMIGGKKFSVPSSHLFDNIFSGLTKGLSSSSPVLVGSIQSQGHWRAMSIQVEGQRKLLNLEGERIQEIRKIFQDTYGSGANPFVLQGMGVGGAAYQFPWPLIQGMSISGGISF